MSAAAPAGPVQFGSFRIGGMHMALPMNVLREVVTCTDLVPLPCATAGVAGGQRVRDAMIPVVDLRVVLDRPARAMENACVIVMIHEGQVLGLLAERIGEVFTLLWPAGGQVGPGRHALYDICIPWGESSPVSVLSPGALLALAQVPAIMDPEPWRSATTQNARSTRARPHLLMRAGPVHLAIDAVTVHSTLAQPTVTAGALTHGHCLGTVQSGPDRVAAFDLLALCGLGALNASGPFQAFVIPCAGTRVAFLVDAIIDFAAADPEALVPLAPFALPRAGLVRGLLPAGTAAGDAHWLTLDAAGLSACDEVAAVAAATQDAHAGQRPGSGAVQANPKRTLLTFELDRKAAAPLDQIREILPCNGEMSAPGTGPVLGIALSRGRSVTVLSLSHLNGWPDHPPQEGACILVVESGTDLMGFMVQRLCDIETTDWEPTLPRHDASAARQTLAHLDSSGRQRLVPLIDLQDLARRVQANEGWPARRESNPRPTA